VNEWLHLAPLSVLCHLSIGFRRSLALNGQKGAAAKKEFTKQQTSSTYPANTASDVSMEVLGVSRVRLFALCGLIFRAFDVPAIFKHFACTYTCAHSYLYLGENSSPCILARKDIGWIPR
jgi:hypothetical protein